MSDILSSFSASQMLMIELERQAGKNTRELQHQWAVRNRAGLQLRPVPPLASSKNLIKRDRKAQP